MDKRFKRIDPLRENDLLEAFYEQLLKGELTLSEAVKGMRRASRLTQPEFASHRDISLAALRQIESGEGNPTVATLNKVGAIFGLEVGFVRRRR